VTGCAGQRLAVVRALDDDDAMCDGGAHEPEGEKPDERENPESNLSCHS
jgi:hypothetical protein